MKLEEHAREKIDALLEQAGWQVQNVDQTNLHVARGIAIREFPLSGYGFADYLLYLNGQAVGVIEAKKEGTTLSGVETQSETYTKGLPDDLPAWQRPLPFSYQTTGAETRFTNGLDPEPRARSVFAFHQPDQFAKWIGINQQLQVTELDPEYLPKPPTFLSRLQSMQKLEESGLWPAQIIAIKNLEQSLRENRPRSLIQMATGSGKTFTAISFIYRLIKFAGAQRVLFLVDRGNLGDQTLKEFQNYTSPYNNYKFTEEYIVQRLNNNTLDSTARVCISTIQRMYAMLKGQELAEDLEEESADGLGNLVKQPDPIEYNPDLPIETFDIIITDEAHRSIYNLWAQVLEYFDAYLIGLTATPSKQTFGFFNQNLVMEYNHEMAVADGVNVNYDVYRIRTAITEEGSKVEANYALQFQDRDTRQKRWEQLDDDFIYNPNQLDRDVVAPDQIRTIIRTFKDKLFTEIFPGRKWVPKTLIFAKDDAHAENIVEIVREEFAKGNDFAQKITYRTTGKKTPKELISEFRTSPMPRIAITVDMIATGTDIKPVEIVLFMRAVKSRSFFEQMKGRGVRVIQPDDLKSVTPDAVAKDHFVIVDAVGVCEQDKTDSRPMEQKRNVSFGKLLQLVALGNTEDEVLTSLSGRLARMEHHIQPEDEQKICNLTDGLGIKDLSRNIVSALNPDQHREQAKIDLGIAPDDNRPLPEHAIKTARQKILTKAIMPLHNPELRKTIEDIKKKTDIIIDSISTDQILEAGFSADATERAKGITQSFKQFIEDNKDEITALQILYNRPYSQRLSFEAVQGLADVIQKPPYRWSESKLWEAYAALDKSKVKDASGERILTDLVSLVRFALHQDNELVPFPDRVDINYRAWIVQQESNGVPFSDEQKNWLDMIRNHIAGNLHISNQSFEYAPFSQHGGLGKVHQLFGDRLDAMIEELNAVLVA